MFFADLLRRLFLLTLLLAEAWSDVSEGRISNKALFSGFAFTGALNCFARPEVSMEALLYALSVIAVLLLLRRFRLVGGGDIKLLMLIIWTFPGKEGLMVILFSFPAAFLLRMFIKGSIPFALSVFISSVMVFCRG